MAKIKLLSTRAINTLSDGFHSDGGNLFLRVRGESRNWIFRYKKMSKQIVIGLGATHARSLQEAREIAERMRNALANGRNPADELQAKWQHTKTFKEYALALIESKRPSWRNAKHAQQWENTLEQYVHPKIGNKCPTDITLVDIKDILTPLWSTKTETASRIRMRVEAVLDYAAVIENNERRNPARWKGTLDKLFPAPRKIAKRIHFASAPYPDVPRIMSELRIKNTLGAYCLRFIILTAARSMEARSAFWREIDFENKVWRIPAARMKAEREHAVPLCSEAVEILQKMREFQSPVAELVFQGERGGLLSDVSINKILHATASNCTVHGFRSSFRIWGAEMTSTPSTVLELALAHVNQNKTEAAYQRSDLFERRRVLMEAWGIYCSSEGKIINFQKERIA